jgi:hypothetical protein
LKEEKERRRMHKTLIYVIGDSTVNDNLYMYYIKKKGRDEETDNGKKKNTRKDRNS